MKCLITGINGFVGKHLAGYLLEKGCTVGGTVHKKKDISAASGAAGKIQFFPCDISAEREIKDTIKNSSPDIIFHLAAQSFVPDSWKDPAGTFRTNVMGTLYLLEAARIYSPSSKVLIIGSGDEYGQVEENGAAAAEDTCLRPQNPYSVTKVCIDFLSGQLGGYYGLHTVRIRPFPHIGPGQSPRFVTADFARQIALIEKGLQPPVIKTGRLDSRRDFTDVRDMVRAYYLAVEAGKNGEVYNICSGRTYSIEYVLERLICMSRKKITVETETSRLRPKDTLIQTGNNTKFCRDTGWKPHITMEKTLADILDWWRKQIETEGILRRTGSRIK